MTPATYRGPGGTLLHIITLFGHANFVPKLILDGIDINEQNCDGETALHIAARTGRLSILDVLLADPKIDDSVTNKEGLTPYQIAKNRQIATAIEYARSIFINRKTKEMHGLVARGDLEGFKALFDNHRTKAVLNVDSPDDHGDTILHVAAKLDDLAMLKLCLEYGADPFVKNKKNKLPIELAKNEQIKTVLKEAPMITSKGGLLSMKSRLEGYLNKWTNYAEGYKKRWFVLEEGVLSYYKSQAEYPVNCRGSINMSFAKVHRHNADKLRFEVIALTNSSNKMHIRAENVAEAQKWIIALNQASVYSMSGSSSDVEEKEKTSSEPLVLALSTAENYKDLVGKALNQLSELEILLNEHLNPEIGTEPPKLTVENTVKYIFAVREALLASEEQEKQWHRKYDFERAQRKALEESYQKLAIEASRIEQYTRIKAIEEIKGKSLLKQDVSVESLTDEFYDAVEAELVIAEPEYVEKRVEGVRIEFVSQELIGYPPVRREALPADSTTMKPVSLWSIIKNALGKDLTRIPIPVNYCEPISMLQRLCEEMEYSELLDLAASSTDPLVRIQFVAAFAASSYASTDGRVTKPFNPLLGETFEYVSHERGFRYVSEQVSHHPPISACHCESANYRLWAEVNVKSTTWGKSIELTPEGYSHVVLKLADGQEEHYSWKKVKTSVNNIVVGKLWIDHHGEMKIACHETGVSCSLDFKATGWRTVGPKRIEGQVMDPKGNIHYELHGFWNSRLTSTHCQSGDQLELWRKRPLPPHATVMYKFSTFSMTLNELTEDLAGILAPTDSRLRPDQRAMENGDFEAANTLKVELEDKQRSTRKLLEAQGMSQPGPRWFKREQDSLTGAYHWVFTEAYWQCRARRDWTDVPNIFCLNK